MAEHDEITTTELPGVVAAQPQRELAGVGVLAVIDEQLVVAAAVGDDPDALAVGRLELAPLPDPGEVGRVDVAALVGHQGVMISRSASVPSDCPAKRPLSPRAAGSSPALPAPEWSPLAYRYQ